MVKSTWDRKVRVNKKMVPKREVLAYYKKLWAESPEFRSMLRTKGAFIRASYDGKTVIKRHNVKLNNWNDVESIVREHGVEFHVLAKKTKFASYLDVDLPPRQIPNRMPIARSIIKKLKSKKVNVSLVTDAPSGVHIFSKTPKPKLIKALKEIEAKDKRIFVGKFSKTKIVVDPNEPNFAVPNSLSCKGKPYRVWKK
jgi:hypothetical protein